ncbi:hypothetical protein F2Q68_00040466 [Brassica cretica]|uniref:Uncharacterized protein n=3 Tax=Brassica cretica TaxID=69181 RepID=A0A8S9MR23_BRACR|nr:hypothetical protein F2Q68_00040466 [Brassica cretica]
MRPKLKVNHLFSFRSNQKRLWDKCWIQYWSVHYWAVIKDMDRKELKPIANIRTQDEAIEVSEIAEQEMEIAEQLQKSRGRLSIKEEEWE